MPMTFVFEVLDWINEINIVQRLNSSGPLCLLSLFIGATANPLDSNFCHLFEILIEKSVKNGVGAD